MKKYIDIQVVREIETVLDDITLPVNTGAFQVGDIISITEKMDGANASIRYDEKEDVLRAFSRNNELSKDQNLRGFWEYVQKMDKEPFARYPHYIFFGEWLVKHTVIYEKDNYDKFYLFSIFDGDADQWLPQDSVKSIADECGIPYVHELYYGKFISWDHCKQFANDPAYGNKQEGIVIKNQTALSEGREPHVLKYVNPEFYEIKVDNRRQNMRKRDDSLKKADMDEAERYIRMIVTEARVRKIINKLVDEGIMPEKIERKDLQIIYKNLPKRIYEDCLKEEPEIIQKAGNYAGKMCMKVGIEIFRKKWEL